MPSFFKSGVLEYPAMLLLLRFMPELPAMVCLFQLLNRYAVVGIDADITGNLHGLLRDFECRKLRFFEECACRSRGVAAAGSDGRNGLVWVDNVSRSGEDERLAFIGYKEQRFKIAQHLVGAPILRQLDGRAVKLAGKLLQLGLKTRKEIEGVRSGSGKPGKYLVLIEAANLPRGVFQHVIAERNLPIGGHDDLPGAADTNHRCGSGGGAGWAG